MSANIIDILKERCLLDDVTSPEVSKLLEKPVTLYAGFDPTSSSLQVGNFVAIMALAHFQRAGHKIIALVGGATGMIGDPSGKTAERTLLSGDEINRNVEGIRENLQRVLGVEDGDDTVKLVNNNDWLENFTFIEFLRDVGKHFRMGTMLGKESVRARLGSEAGMSFTEFSYQMLQAYDFLNLYDAEECVLQVGGSDQWGNITAGIDLVRKLRGKEVFGVTMPLVCDSSGQKFGKSEGNAVYLDSEKTSCYDFYQFFVRTGDADVIRFLKIFTFLPMEEIAQLEKEVEEAPGRRAAQKRLAEEVTRMVHGDAGLESARRASAVMYGESMDGLKAEDLMNVFADVDSAEISSVVDMSLIDAAVESGLCKSKSDARRLIGNGGLYLNNNRVESIDAVVRESDVIDGTILVLRSGKKNYRLVKVG